MLASLLLMLGLARVTQADAGAELSMKYLSVNDSDPGPGWGDDTTASEGQIVEFYIEVKNVAVPSTAENVEVRVLLPSHLAAITSTVYANLKDTAGSTDVTRVTLGAADLRLVPISGSTKVTADLNGDGTEEMNEKAWDNDNLFDKGILLGNLVGGEQSYIQLSFRARVVKVMPPSLETRLLVRKVTEPDQKFSSEVEVSPGETVLLSAEIHNLNVPSQATKVNLRLALPEEEGNDFTIFGTVRSDEVEEVSQSVHLRISSNARLKSVAGSIKLTWDYDGDGKIDFVASPIEGDSPFTSQGYTLPKVLYGCNPYVANIQAEVLVEKVEDLYTDLSLGYFRTGWQTDSYYDKIEKSQHFFLPGQRVFFQIEVRNEGNSAADPVRLEVSLPEYLGWSEDPQIRQVTVYRGSLAAETTLVLGLEALVLEVVPDGDQSQTATAKLFEGETLLEKKTTSFTVVGPEVLGVSATEGGEEIEELPETSLGDFLVAILQVVGSGIMVLVGLGLRYYSEALTYRFASNT